MGRNIEEEILKVYFENPEKRFTIRDLSKKTHIPRSTVHKKLADLIKQKLIDKENMAGDGLFFKFKKINYYTEKLAKTGLVNFLIENLNPSCIILFGSVRKGESNKESDVDLFVESSSKKDLDLRKFERKIGHKIDLFIEPDLKKLNSNLFNNVVNGIKLFGSFKIK